MYLSALRASAVVCLAAFLGACSGGSDQVSTDDENGDSGQPIISLSAADNSVLSGGSTMLSWSASGADSCSAAGGWSGNKDDSGSEQTPALTQDTQFSLSCSGPGGNTTASVTVRVNDGSDPTVTLSAADTSVDAGDTTTLTWSSTGTDSCTASGGWSGNKNTSGNEATAPVTANTTYTLTCSGPGGNAMAMIEVSANGLLSISWQAPTENVDGSPLTDLGGYTIYYGETSGNYTDEVSVNNPNATSFSVTLASGQYYVAMTATDVDGNESAMSNEVLKATL